MKTSAQIIGHMLGSSHTGFAFSCIPECLSTIRVGMLLRSKTITKQPVFSILYGIEWLSDELIRQLAQAASLNPGIIQDNMISRTSGPLLYACYAGHEGSDGQILHHLPPASSGNLSDVMICSEDEIIRFLQPGTSYLHYLLKSSFEFPVADVLALHLREIHKYQSESWLNNVLNDLADYLISEPQLTLRIFHLLANPGEGKNTNE